MDQQAKVIAELTERKVKRVKLAVVDMDGVLRGKYISFKKFISIVENGSGFCDCVFGWDVADNLYDNGVEFTGWHTGYPDAPYQIVLSSMRWLEDENLPLFLADFVDIDGKSPHPIAPRSILKRVLKQAEELGIGFKSAFEYEFFIFNETADTIREKGYRNLKPLTPGMFGYSILRASSLSDLFNEFMEYSDSLNIPLEAVHCETGPGVWEAAIEVDYALAAADKATLFKTFAKVFFQRREMVATFMARWSLDYPGQSGHVHLSPYSLDDGKNLFYDPSRKNNMSSMMEHFLAGMITHMRPFLSMTAPTINSYTRLVKGFWAPTAATWGVENRTTALRVVPGSDKSQRVEYRVGAADSNPYLTAAALIGAGLEGINSKLKLSAPVIGSAYDVQDSLDSSLQLPSSLKESTLGLRQSEEAVSLFGAKFVDHFAKSREWEVAEYEKVITDWQLSRYFEII